jgi:hypothetical protein
MRSRKKSNRIPWPLDDAMKKICKEEGYKNDNACTIGALVRFVQDHRRREWVRNLANAKPRTQDFIMSKMFSFPTDPEGMIRELRKLDRK